MRNPRFDPNDILVNDQRTARYKQGMDYEDRYKQALFRYLDDHSEDMRDQIVMDYWTKANSNYRKSEDKKKTGAILSRARYGDFPTIQSAGEHLRSLTPLMKKLLGL